MRKWCSNTQEGTVSSSGGVGRSDGDRGSSGEFAGHVQGREALESWGRSVGASSEEGGSQGDDRSGVDRGVERGGERRLSVDQSDVGVVTSLNSQDGGSSGKVGRVLDGTSGTEVSGYTDTLEDLRNSQEGLGVDVREGVVTSLNGGGTGGGQSGGQKGNVGSLVVRDGLDLLAGVITKTGTAECLGVILGKTLRVKRGLEVLKSQREVKDIRIGNVAGGLLHAGGSQQDGGCDDRGSHVAGVGLSGGVRMDRVGITKNNDIFKDSVYFFGIV